MIGHIFTLKQLEALVWVADLGSFRKAAAHLNTTQPNISARIAGLETTLGTILMQRDAGSVRLTEKGEEIVQAARRVLRQSEDLITIAERPDLMQDRLRLGVTELIAGTWLHPYLRKLKETYPGISVELTVDLSRNLDRALNSHTLDLTIQTAPFALPVSGTIALGDYLYGWVADPTIAAALPGKQTVADLTAFNVLTHARHTQSFVELTEHADTTGIAKARFVPSSSLSSCLQMAVEGMGVALVPLAMAERDIAAGRLVVIDADWMAKPLQVAARFHADKVAGYVAQAAQIALQIAETYRT
ncbi:MAG: LysR family transcriptional regulator [Yoonia sp.]|uniref:LysR family transcriptional regulator n=1 Tax=Yoonia sp. TaxID=2212373 RepID=UPI0032675488